MSDPDLDVTTHLLSDDRHRKIFESRIVPFELSAGTAQEQPYVLLLGGQTGAGKSVMKGRLTSGPKWVEAVEFGSDTLRVHHPDYKALLAVDADRACFYTDPDARSWVNDALDHCLEQRFSVIFDSTLSRPATAESISTRFHQAGYQIEAAFVAVSAAQSRLGVVTRYLDSVQEREAGRFSLNHDETYEGVVAVAGWVDETAPFDRVSVYRRNGEQLYTNSTDAVGQWIDPPNARQAIEDERLRPWSESESQIFVNTIQSAAQQADTLKQNGQPLPPIWLSRIADAGELGLPLATGPAHQELQDAVSSLRQEVTARMQPTETARELLSPLQSAARTATAGHDRNMLLQAYQERRTTSSTKDDQKPNATTSNAETDKAISKSETRRGDEDPRHEPHPRNGPHRLT